MIKGQLMTAPAICPTGSSGLFQHYPNNENGKRTPGDCTVVVQIISQFHSLKSCKLLQKCKMMSRFTIAKDSAEYFLSSSSL